MWRCVDRGLTEISEECVASIFRVEKSTSEEPASAGGKVYVYRTVVHNQWIKKDI
jgi:hypothetical protein